MTQVHLCEGLHALEGMLTLLAAKAAAPSTAAVGAKQPLADYAIEVYEL